MPIAPETFAVGADAGSRRTLCSVTDAGWHSLLVRRFESTAAEVALTTAAIPDQRIVLLERGPVHIESRAGRRSRRALYAPGELGLTAPGVECDLAWRLAGPDANLTTHVFVPGTLMRSVASTLGRGERAEFPDSLVANDPVVASVVTGLVTAVRAGVDDLYAESAAVFLAAHLVGMRSPEPQPAGTGSVRDRRIRGALDHMNDNLALPMTLADLAGVAGLSPFHFLRLFEREVGQPPRRHLMSLRAERAAQHLRRSGLPVGEIAYLCGFSSAAHLATAFRRRYGTSPTAYRAAARAS